MPHTPEEELVEELGRASRGRAWVRRLAVLGLSLLATVVIVQLIGRIDWSSVRDALGHLAWWQLVVLAGALGVRQLLNALPLRFFIPGLSTYRALVNDLAAHLLAVVAPPPGDMVMRVGMFTSWGVDPSRAVAGTLMNMIAFYILRFAMPILGVVILLPLRFDGAYALTAALSAAVSGAIVVLVVLGLRSEAFAERIGRTAGTVVARLRKSVSPDLWAAATVQFRLDMKSTFGSGFPRSAFALVGLVFADATVLLLAMRFVGIPASDLPAIELYAAFLCVYPLTLFPFMGLGVVDAVLLGTVVEVAGIEAEAAAVAALVVWRIYTLGGPIALGAAAMGLWRRSTRLSAAVGPPENHPV